MAALLAAFIAAVGLLPALLALYLVVLAVAAFGSAPSPAVRRAERRVTVLVPAHDEAALIARCVHSLLAQDYPRDLLRIVVIADNCSDATAEIARRAGAEVMERVDPSARGKGHALRWAIDRLLASPDAPDAIGVVDADSVADPRLIIELERSLDSCRVAQAEYLVLTEDGSGRTRLMAAAFLLFHRVRFGGRARLGLPAALVGNGMLFSAGLLRDHPWDAFTGVEDLEYTIRLRLAGERPAFVRAAGVRGPMAAGYRATARQRARWEGGRLHAMRLWLPRLLRASLADPRLLDAAIDLAVPPLGLFAAVVMAGTAAAGVAALLGLVPIWAALPWVLAALALPAFVLIGLAAARAPRECWLALLEAPRFLIWKLAAYRRLLRGFDPSAWERSQRAGDDGAEWNPAPMDLGGVRVDPLTMEGARARLRDAIRGDRLFQVSTVNLDFLARAQTDPALRRALQSSALNVPDGAPVVWLGRLLGRRVPERVAGADLVPLLLEDAARAGASVFLLGGEAGAAAAAAAYWQASIPGMRIAGCYEPPRAPLDQLDEVNGERIVDRINRSGASVLLVALGHPKQELWIDGHREQLTVSVAVGVGCVFDLAAGRSRRAPAWMQSAGLEWLYRAGREPRRLAGRYAADLRWLAILGPQILRRRLIEQIPVGAEQVMTTPPPSRPEGLP